MFCNACGHPNPDNAVFCAKCGASMTPLAVAGASASATAPAIAPGVAVRSEPRMDTPRAGAQSIDFDEEALRAAIGPKNTEYYLPRFEAAATQGTQARWHWPALFVTGYWLLYRKMWLNAFLYILVLPFAGAFLLGIVAALVGGSNVSNKAMDYLPLAYFVLVLLLSPLFANQLYYRHVRHLIATAQATSTDRQRQLSYLDAKGGTSALVLILVAILGIAMIGILAAVALPAYQDYTKRAKVAEAVMSAITVARAVGETYETTGTLPDNLDDAKSKTFLSKYLTSLELGPKGVLELGVTVSPSQTIPMTLTPSLGGDRHITWTCGTEPSMRKWVPSSCRN